MYKLKTLILYHRRLHPSLEPPDIYKLLFQATMGPAHILDNEECAFLYLRRECDDLGQYPNADEILIEPVSNKADVIRINLRPFKRESNNIHLLFDCMIQSAIHFSPCEERLRELWKEFTLLTRYGDLDFDFHEVATLDSTLLNNGFVPMSHSDSYIAKEQPSYRVVLAYLFKQSFCTGKK